MAPWTTQELSRLLVTRRSGEEVGRTVETLGMLLRASAARARRVGPAVDGRIFGCASSLTGGLEIFEVDAVLCCRSLPAVPGRFFGCPRGSLR